MNDKLVALKKRIFYGEHSDEEWKRINEEVQNEFLVASEEDKAEFVQCGAGPLLEQILEYMD